MGAGDYNQDAGRGLRMGTTEKQLQQAHDHAIAEKASTETWVAGAAVALIVVAVVVAHCVARHRHKIARAAAAAIVSGLATGVRAARTARIKRAAWVSRIVAKADENTPSPD